MNIIEKTVDLYPAQADFLYSPAPFRGFVGGRGAGKSWVGAYDLLMRAQPGRLYLAGAPTYTVLQDATWRTLLGLARDLDLLGELNRSDLRLTTADGAEIIGRSADNPERFRGPNLSGAWLDEASQMDAAAFEVTIACLREAGEQGWLSATYTPRGRQHWTYEVFGMGRPDTAQFQAATGENPFLPESFEETIRRQYTSHYALQELAGEYVDPAGNIVCADWFAVVPTTPTKAARVRYWDKAATEGAGAYSCGVLMQKDHEGRYAVEDVVRGQWSSMRRNAEMLNTARSDRARYGHVTVWVEQEPGSGGKESAESTVRQLAGYDVRLDRVTGDKVTRFQPFAAQAEARNIRVRQAPWNADYLSELAVFPEGRYKDQADATSGAFNKLAPLLVGGPALGTAPEGSLIDQMPRGVFRD